jgi:hypothetical protein
MKFVFISLYTLCLFKLNALCLKEKLANGRVGDYIVTQEKNICTLIRLDQISPGKISIEEISFPKSDTPKNYQSWLLSNAKGATSWTIYEIDLSKNEILKAYSVSKKCDLSISMESSFLLRLLTDNFDLIPHEERKKIGQAPKEGEDFRKIWNPPFVFEGKTFNYKKPLAVKLIHPKDNSPLSGKRIELFFCSDIENFPFPFWGQVTDSSEAAFKFRAIDSGRNLISPKKG